METFFTKTLTRTVVNQENQYLSDPEFFLLQTRLPSKSIDTTQQQKAIYFVNNKLNTQYNKNFNIRPQTNYASNQKFNVTGKKLDLRPNNEFRTSKDSFYSRNHPTRAQTTRCTIPINKCAEAYRKELVGDLTETINDIQRSVNQSKILNGKKIS